MSQAKRKPTARKPQRTTKPITTAPDGYLSRRQASAFCGGLNLQIIDSAIRRGELRAYKPAGRKGKGRRVLIGKADLVAWLQAAQV